MTDSDREKIRELKDKVFRYGMLYGERLVLNTVLTYMEEAVEHPQVINDALKNLTAVSESTEEDYAMAKAEAKSFCKDIIGEEEDDEQQGQGEAL